MFVKGMGEEKKQVKFGCDGIKNVLVRRKGGIKSTFKSGSSEFGEGNVGRKDEMKNLSFTF